MTRGKYERKLAGGGEISAREYVKISILGGTNPSKIPPIPTAKGTKVAEGTLHNRDPCPQTAAQNRQDVMASILTTNELRNPTDGVSGVTGAAGQAASVEATPKAVGAKAVRVRFTGEEKMILLKEVIASGAHVAAYGTKEKKFEEAVEKINANPRFRVTLKTRAAQEKFNNMIKEFHKRDNKDRRKTGSSDEMSEEDQLLSSIVDAVDDLQEAEKSEKGKAAEAEARKRAASNRVLAMANGDSSGGVADGEDSVENGAMNGDEDKEEETPRGRKRRRKTPVVGQLNDGLARFGESMRDVEVAKLDLQAKRLAFEERCHEDNIRERAQQRRDEAEQREKREAADMQRLQAMLDFAVKSIKKQ